MTSSQSPSSTSPFWTTGSKTIVLHSALNVVGYHYASTSSCACTRLDIQHLGFSFASSVGGSCGLTPAPRTPRDFALAREHLVVSIPPTKQLARSWSARTGSLSVPQDVREGDPRAHNRARAVSRVLSAEPVASGHLSNTPRRRRLPGSWHSTKSLWVAMARVYYLLENEEREEQP